MIGHCRMSSRSRALITATCKALAVNVLFCAQSSGNVRMLGFQQGNALEFLKYFGTLSLFHFKAMPWSDNFSSTNQKTGRGNRQKEVQCHLFTGVYLSSRVGSLLPYFYMFWRPAFRARVTLLPHHGPLDRHVGVFLVTRLQNKGKKIDFCTHFPPLLRPFWLV